MMRYIRGTHTLPLIISANGSSILKWWVDASFAVHPNMRGNYGGGFSLVCKFPILSSTKKELKTRSSTKTELVGSDDFMPAICWSRYFLNYQEYRVLENILFQEKRGSILLDKYGKASSSKRTKHIHLWYLFIIDTVSQGDVSLVWCPTGDMIEDFMTNPTQ